MTMAITEQHDFFFGSGAATRSLFPNDETNLTSNRDAQKAAADAKKQEELRQQNELDAQDEIKKLTASNQALLEGKERAEEDLTSAKGEIDMAEQERKVSQLGKELAEETNRLQQKEIEKLEDEITKLVEENNRLDGTIERMDSFEGSEIYLYNILTKTTINYDPTRQPTPYAHGFELQIGTNDFQAWQFIPATILKDGGRPVGPPSFRIENIKSNCCLEFSHSGDGEPLYASLYRFDASQHWYCQTVNTGQENLIGRGNFALVNVKYKTAMCLVDLEPPRPGFGIRIVSTKPNTSYSNQPFPIVARPIREVH